MRILIPVAVFFLTALFLPATAQTIGVVDEHTFPDEATTQTAGGGCLPYDLQITPDGSKGVVALGAHKLVGDSTSQYSIQPSEVSYSSLVVVDMETGELLTDMLSNGRPEVELSRSPFTRLPTEGLAVTNDRALIVSQPGNKGEIGQNQQSIWLFAETTGTGRLEIVDFSNPSNVEHNYVPGTSNETTAHFVDVKVTPDLTKAVAVAEDHLYFVDLTANLSTTQFDEYPAYTKKSDKGADSELATGSYEHSDWVALSNDHAIVVSNAVDSSGPMVPSTSIAIWDVDSENLLATIDSNTVATINRCVTDSGASGCESTDTIDELDETWSKDVCISEDGRWAAVRTVDPVHLNKNQEDIALSYVPSSGGVLIVDLDSHDPNSQSFDTYFYSAPAMSAFGPLIPAFADPGPGFGNNYLPITDWIEIGTESVVAIGPEHNKGGISNHSHRVDIIELQSTAPDEHFAHTDIGTGTTDAVDGSPLDVAISPNGLLAGVQSTHGLYVYDAELGSIPQGLGGQPHLPSTITSNAPIAPPIFLSMGGAHAQLYTLIVTVMDTPVIDRAYLPYSDWLEMTDDRALAMFVEHDPTTDTFPSSMDANPEATAVLYDLTSTTGMGGNYVEILAPHTVGTYGMDVSLSEYSDAVVFTTAGTTLTAEEHSPTISGFSGSDSHTGDHHRLFAGDTSDVHFDRGLAASIRRVTFTPAGGGTSHYFETAIRVLDLYPNDPLGSIPYGTTTNGTFWETNCFSSPNSTSSIAELELTSDNGSGSTFTATNLPGNEPIYVLVNSGMAYPTAPFAGSSALYTGCLQGIPRPDNVYTGNTGSGTFSATVSYGTNPAGWSPSPGETWFVQCYYRDATLGHDETTNSIRVEY